VEGKKTFSVKGIFSNEKLIFFLLFLLYLVPIWFFPYFLTQDGPAYVANAKVAASYHDPAAFIYPQYYFLRDVLQPNSLVHYILTGLLLFLSPAVAEKILLSGWVILFPLSVVYALRSINKNSIFLALLVFPFIYNFFLHMGFYKFVYGLIFFFFLIGFWLKHFQNFRWIHCLGLLGATLLLYVSHISLLAAAWLVVGSLSFWFFSISFRAPPPEGTNIKRYRIQMFLFCLFSALVLAGVAGIISAMSDKLTMNKEMLGLPSLLFPQSYPDFSSLLLRFVQLSSLVSFQSWETIISTTVFIAYMGLLIYFLFLKFIRFQFNRWDGMLILFFALVTIYFLSPRYLLDYYFISHRAQFFPFFILILWLGCQNYNEGIKRLVKGVALVLAVLALILRLPTYTKLNTYLEEYLSAKPVLKSNTTLLPLHFSQQGYEPEISHYGYKIHSFGNAAGYLAADRDVVNLGNYQAMNRAEFFPIGFRPETDPTGHFSGKDKEPPCVKFLKYDNKANASIDTVLLWNIQDVQRSHSCVRSIFRQLNKRYELIYQSPEKGILEIYGKKS